MVIGSGTGIIPVTVSYGFGVIIGLAVIIAEVDLADKNSIMSFRLLIRI